MQEKKQIRNAKKRAQVASELAQRTDRAKTEILADVAAGVVPGTVQNFSELHNYVDANGYGGAFEDTAPDPRCQIWNDLQAAVDGWIRSGAMARAFRETK